MSGQLNAPDRKALLKQALTALDDMQAKLDASERARREPIAIVGMSCRLPGGIETPEALWTLLDQGGDGVSEVPRDRWNIDDYYDADPKAPGRMCTRRGGFLTHVDRFDPQFFGIAPREAQSMDPQQRLLLEVSWEALERAGQAPDRLQGSLTGVFVGITTSDYRNLIDFGDPRHADVYAATGNALNAAAGRLSFTLGLQGPCMALDTACSSSLVALHNACVSLRCGESDLALAAGVNVMLAPETFVLFSKWGMLAPDGRCKTFDARADGFVRGEGCVVVVLKRLSDALAQGDDVLAVIRGSAVNQDGRSSGLTVPNGPAQQAVIRRALAAAGLQPADIDYIEAHGTGTPLGDPIEVEALAAVLGKGRTAPLNIGSIKTNIGHVEAASGLAGLMKVVLGLRHNRIPKHLHFESPNPRIAWETMPIRVAADPVEWVRGERPRIAGVSSFGFSGTNAHVIVEEAPLAVAPPSNQGAVQVLTLSAKTPRALAQLAASYGERLANGVSSVDAACFTANTGRAQFHHRLAVTGTSADDIAVKLSGFREDRKTSGVFHGQAGGADATRLAMLFTGQGSQYAGMGRGLYDTEPEFKAAIDRCAAILSGVSAVPLLDVLYGDQQERLVQTECTQPALFALEYALAQLWRSWGVVPTVVLGHSVGEYVAACVAGVFELEDALTLIAARGRLMQALPAGGAMAAVFASETVVAEAVAAVGPAVAIAAVNAPDSIVVSGAEAGVNAVIERLAAAGVKSQRLSVSHAFHSPLMEPMLDEFEAIASRITCRAPRLALVSNETGRIVRAGAIDAAYWRRHVRAAVQFRQSIAEVRASGCELFLEAGPSPTLLGLGRRTVEGGAWIPSLRQGRDDRAEMLAAAAALYTRGVAVDFGAMTLPAARRHLALPTYPFQRDRFWIQDVVPAPSVAEPTSSRGRIASLAGSRLSSPLPQIQFETVLTAESGWLAEHVIYGACVFPATGHIELAREAAERAFAAPSSELLAISNHEPLVLSASEPRRVQVVLDPLVDGASVFRILSLRTADGAENGSWQLHVSGRVKPAAIAPALEASETLEALRARCTEAVDVAGYYADMAQRGLEYGARFRGVTALWEGVGEAIGMVTLPDADNAPDTANGIHPALLDSCFHVVGRAIAPGGRDDAYLPIGTDRVAIVAGAAGAVWSHATVAEVDAATLSATIRLFDQDGQPIAIVDGLRLRRMAKAALARWAGAPESDERQWLHEIDWVAAPVADRDKAAEGGTWLVFADALGVAESFRQEQIAEGAEVVCVRPADGEGDLSIDPDTIDGYVAAMQRPSRVRGVVFAWGLDGQDRGVVPQSAAACRQLMLLTQAILRVQATEPPALVVLTRGAAPIATAVSAGQTPLSGFLRSVAREYPRLRAVTIDLDPRETGIAAGVIAREVDAAVAEEDVAYRGAARYVRRLVATSSRGNAAGRTDSGPVRLEIASRGVLDNLRLAAAERRAPDANEVEIEVRAAGLNFRDVLNALGMYPGEPGPLGSDCAGVVTRVGSGVGHLQPGDEVVGLMTGCFGTFATGPAALLQRKPARLSFADAVTVPNAFLTAWHALQQVGGMRRGERVLIHAATGGVGLAAVQLARAAGAEVFATAGSERKRAFLRSMGVEHVMDSRALTFADEIAIVTAGEGVHLVLNSISGPAIEASLSAMGPAGRFLEIGKNGIWTAAEVARVRPDIRYEIVDLGEAIVRDVAAIRAPFVELLERLEARQLDPLPTEEFAIADAITAFRHMAAAKHIGKIVIVPQPSAASAAGDVNCSPEATYVVTGGFGGLGLATASWLASRGARRVMLIGRSNPKGDAIERVQQLRASGVEVIEAIGDVSSRSFVAAAFERAAQSGHPVKGIVHAAGVLRDAPVQQLSWPQYADVWAPKVEGAWNLHELTMNTALEFFVMFSSMSAVLGAAGQASYTASNSFIDGLAHARRAQGLPAISINWGPWSEVGMAAGIGPRDRERWNAQGIGTIAPEQGLRALEHAFARGEAQISVLPIDWRRFLATEGRTDLPLLRSIADAIGGVAPAGRSAEISFADRLAAAEPQDRPDILFAHVRSAVGAVLAMDESQLSDTQGLTDIGMDSLMAVELSNRLSASIGSALPTTLAFEQPTIAALAAFLGSLLRIETAPAVSSAPDADASKQALDEVMGLTDDEVASSLAAELEEAGY